MLAIQTESASQNRLVKFYCLCGHNITSGIQNSSNCITKVCRIPQTDRKRLFLGFNSQGVWRAALAALSSSYYNCC